ncbi:MAG: response regulator [Bacteroidales bacterium]|jgi:CheY-like chemotaxis protein|nr:response regulator [Bacteroidales bacterium]
MKKYNFLIVDDIFMNRMLLKEIISKISNSTTEAENGLEAIEILQNQQIDIVLMDIEMPKMNGLETTKYIRSEFKPPLNKIPIIALTAHNPSEFFDDHYSAGFNKLLTKPYSITRILESIESFEI